MSTSKPSRKEQTHDRILDVAARAIRRAGYEGVGVADIMKEAGLTHGGYYAHFASRDAMLVEAIERAGRDSAARLGASTAARQARGASPFRALVEAYLSESHIDGAESGCPIAALIGEMPRQSDEVRAASTRRVRALIERVAQALPAGTDEACAAVIASTMVGALQLARSLEDHAAGKTLLKGARQSLLDQYDKTTERGLPA